MTTTEQDLIQAMGAVADAPWIQEELTPSGQLSVGGYALGVTDVVLGLVGGANVNPNDLAASASATVCSLVCDLVGGLFGACATVVPFVGQIFESVIGILSGLDEAEKAEEQARQQQLEQACRAEQQKWSTLGSGAWGQVLPADYFVRARRDQENRWTIERDAFVGQFLRMVLTEQWPRWFVEGYDRRASTREWMRLMGANVIPDAEATASTPLFRSQLAENVYRGLHQSEVDANGNVSQSDARNWPPDCAEKRIALQVANGIAGQHPAMLWQQGRPLGEAGREAWPLFCDLIYFLCRVPRPPWWADGVPWDQTEVEALGLLPVPTLQEAVVRSLYSQPIDSARMDDPAGIFTEWNRITRTDLPYLQARPNPIGSCRGFGTIGCNTLYGIADGWRFFALPATQSDADYRDQQIREAWAWMWEQTGGPSKIAGRIHEGMRASFPAGTMPIARERARKAIELVAAELGWSPAAQAEANAIIEAENKLTAQRVKAATTSVALGVGAVGGALGLAYLWSR